MANKPKTGGKGARKIGRWSRKPGNLRYKLENRRHKNKLKRIRKSSGEKAALEYEKRRLREV